MTRRSGRLAVASIGGALALALLVPLGVMPSLANWGDKEVDHATVGTLNCSANSAFNTSAWGRVIAGKLGTTSLDGAAAFTGLTVTNNAPATVSSATGASPRTDLTNNAWSSVLNLSALSTAQVSAGVTLPLSANTGAYTQYGRATASGVSTGASGALTSAGGGLVSLTTPDSSTPTIGTLSLGSILSSAISSQLAANASRLANLSLGIGAVSSSAQLDACGAAWAALSNQASYVTRNYILASLAANFQSSTVSAVSSGLTATTTGLNTSLNAILAPGTSVTGATLTTLQTTLNTILSSLNILGLQLAGGGIQSLKVGVVFDLSAITTLLTTPLTSGSVSIDLAAGTISANLAGANGLVNLNSLPANSSLLTAGTVTKLTQDVTNAINGFVTGSLTTALGTVVKSAAVTVDVLATIKAAGVNILGLTIKLTGTLGAFTGDSAYGVVTPVITLAPTGLLGGVLGLLGLDQTAFLNGVISGLTTPLITTFVPALAGGILNATLATAQAQVSAALTTLSSTTLPPLIAQFNPVFVVLQSLLALTANAQPDKSGSVGLPDASAPGSYFISALKIGAVNPSTSDSLLSLYLANSSVGPDQARP